MRSGSVGFIALFFLCNAALLAGPAPETIEYPVDQERSVRFLGEEIEVVAYRDPVALTDNNRWVKSIGENGYFYIKKRLLIQTVVITARPGEDGEVDLRLWINNIKRDYPENHTRLIGNFLEEAAEESGLGATAAITRLYADGGVDAVYEAFRWIKDKAVRMTLIEGFVLKQSLDGHESLSVLEWALPAIGDDEKSEVILTLAAKLDKSDSVTAALFAAARGIVSSGTKKVTVIRIAETRGLAHESAVAALSTVKGIPSSDDKKDALIELSHAMPHTPGVLDAWFSAARSIASSDDKERVLTTLLESRPVAARANVSKFLDVARSIPSSDDKGEVLIKLTVGGYVTGEMTEKFLNTCRTIASSDDKRRVLTVFLDSRSRLTKKQTERFLSVTQSIPSSDGKREVLLHMLRTGYVTTEYAPAYLSVVRSIPSSDDKTEVLIALIKLNGLDDDFLAEVAEFAAKHLFSSDDRERVLKEVINYR